MDGREAWSEMAAETLLPVFCHGFPAFKKLFPDGRFEFPAIQCREFYTNSRKCLANIRQDPTDQLKNHKNSLLIPCS